MQDDDEIALVNACADLVGLRKAEAFPRLLLESKQPGEWVCVCEVCHRLGVPVANLRPGVFATWLPDPMAHNGYAVILFYDDESKWSMVAHYNRRRTRRFSRTGPPFPLQRPSRRLRRLSFSARLGKCSFRIWRGVP